MRGVSQQLRVLLAQLHELLQDWRVLLHGARVEGDVHLAPRLGHAALARHREEVRVFRRHLQFAVRLLERVNQVLGTAREVIPVEEQKRRVLAQVCRKLTRQRNVYMELIFLFARLQFSNYVQSSGLPCYLITL